MLKTAKRHVYHGIHIPPSIYNNLESSVTRNHLPQKRNWTVSVMKLWSVRCCLFSMLFPTEEWTSDLAYDNELLLWMYTPLCICLKLMHLKVARILYRMHVHIMFPYLQVCMTFTCQFTAQLFATMFNNLTHHFQSSPLSKPKDNWFSSIHLYAFNFLGSPSFFNLQQNSGRVHPQATLEYWNLNANIPG